MYTICKMQSTVLEVGIDKDTQFKPCHCQFHAYRCDWSTASKATRDDKWWWNWYIKKHSAKDATVRGWQFILSGNDQFQVEKRTAGEDSSGEDDLLFKQQMLRLLSVTNINKIITLKITLMNIVQINQFY